MEGLRHPCALKLASSKQLQATEQFVGELRDDNAMSGKRVLRASVTRASDVAALRSRCLAKVLSHGGEEWAPDDATGDEGGERQALSRVNAKVVTDVIYEFGDVCSLSRVHLSTERGRHPGQPLEESDTHLNRFSPPHIHVLWGSKSGPTLGGALMGLQHFDRGARARGVPGVGLGEGVLAPNVPMALCRDRIQELHKGAGRKKTCPSLMNHSSQAPVLHVRRSPCSAPRSVPKVLPEGRVMTESCCCHTVQAHVSGSCSRNSVATRTHSALPSMLTRSMPAATMNSSAPSRMSPSNDKMPDTSREQSGKTHPCLWVEGCHLKCFLCQQRGVRVGQLALGVRKLKKTAERASRATSGDTEVGDVLRAPV